MSRAQDLARIEDILRIKRLLDRPHQIQRRSRLLLQEAHLALADTVFAGAGAANGKRPAVEPFDEFLDPGDVGGILVVNQQQQVKIAVARMADDGREEPCFHDIGMRFGHAVGKP
jgi:hypothetical protein